MNILNNKNKRTSIFKALALCLFAAMLLTLASCDDDMDIQQSYPFTVETMPVPNKVTKGQTVEIRCELKKTGDFANTLYTIRYFQFEGEGTLKMDNGITFLPNDRYLLNEQLTLLPADLLDIFEGHTIARKKLKNELQLFMRGERNVEKYREAGINWWDYCGSILVNSYPTYFEKLPPLIERINREKRNSKNYILFLGSTGTESNQAPCLSLVQFQIEQGELVMTAYQRSSDANLGLPADIYHLYLISRQIELPLKSITLNLGNVHIYENNIDKTEQLLAGNENVKFELNV